jgi:eukaryotic-like serine/threonine-protein kinase
MPLVLGTHLGPYEIISPLGAGGMGEVYRATDTNLKRAVAIKVLPESVAGDAERLARFQREAEVLASLNHSNIAAIYGLERSAGITALVMELVEGPTLADRIAQGPIPIDEALSIARQITEALEAAHEQSIIHRDLKPANVKVRPDGTIKVLDFGLAKAMEPTGAMSPSVSQSPTITSPAMMTGVGMLLGTAAYMSPEQARGKAVDKRSDIWAFGCVLYEMLSGKRAFGGEDVTETLAFVLTKDPDWNVMPPTLPPTVLLLLERCLQRDIRRRVSDVSTAAFALDEGIQGSRSVVPRGANRVSKSWQSVRERRRTFLASGAALLAGSVATGVAVWLAARPPSAELTRFEITGRPNAVPDFNNLDRDLAVSPDGLSIVYRGGPNGARELLVRRLGALEPTSVLTGSPRGLFMSPDGQWIGFFDAAGGGVLKRVSITGGPALTITSVDGSPRGAVWLPDGKIVFATANPDTGLQEVDASGGPVTVLTRPDRGNEQGDHFWPESLREGNAVLYTIKAAAGPLAASQIAVHNRESGTTTVVAKGGSHAQYINTGHLVYVTEQTLYSMAFDAATLTPRGNSVPLVSGVATTADGGVDAVIAGNGTLAYVVTAARFDRRQIVWTDRDGTEEPIALEPRPYQHPRISPDGSALAVDTGGESGVWLWDFARGTATRLTTDPKLGPFRAYPVWSPDGRTITFTSDPQGGRNIFRQPADGSGRVDRLTTSPNLQHPNSTTPDGRLVLFKEVRNGLGGIYTLSTTAGAQPQPLLTSPFDHSVADLSPNGKWIAVQSNESGNYEVYVRPFPDVNSGRWQVSSNGGTFPGWSRDGRELFYVATDGRLVSVSVETEPSFIAGKISQVVKPGFWPGTGTSGRPYDVSPDGKRFLMIKPFDDAASSATRIVVVQNWFEELKRLVPTN